MLKGVCEGDVLLDSDLTICENADCLNRLLQRADMLGQSFSNLIIQDEDPIKTFTKFVEDSADMPNSVSSLPQGLRVSLKGAHRRVAVDVFHVALPKALGLSSARHLLALVQDADTQPHMAEMDETPDRQQSEESGSTSEASSCAEAVQAFEELSQLTLLLNVSTDLMDVEEVYMRFARQTDAEQVKYSMPTLKRFVRPLDWFALERQLRVFADSAARALPKPKKLPPLMLRIPGDSASFLSARTVSVKSIFTGPRPSGQPAWVHLTLSSFNEEPLGRPEVMDIVEENSAESSSAGTEKQKGEKPALPVKELASACQFDLKGNVEDDCTRDGGGPEEL